MTAPVRRVDFGYRSVVWRSRSLALRVRLRPAAMCAAMGQLTLAVTAWSVVSGDYPVTLSQVWDALTDDPAAGFARTVVVDWRLPRAIAAVEFGAALGASGAVFQSLTRNPLASPDIIGFSTGAYTGALVVMILLSGGFVQVAAGAVIGGIATALAVDLLAWRRGVQGFRLIIVGIAVSAMLGAFNLWLIQQAELAVALDAAVWGIGSLNGTGWDIAIAGGAVVAVLLGALALLGRPLRQLELGDDAAHATGARTEAVRLTAMVLGVALIATVTAAAGPIAFVALAAPQIARRIARTPGTPLVPAAFTGALLLATADHTAQHLLPIVLPVGVVTVIVGGGYLVWLLTREVRRRS